MLILVTKKLGFSVWIPSNAVMPPPHQHQLSKLGHLDVQQPSDNSFDPSLPCCPRIVTLWWREGKKGGKTWVHQMEKAVSLCSPTLLSDRPKIWHKCIIHHLCYCWLQWSNSWKVVRLSWVRVISWFISQTGSDIHPTESRNLWV